MRIWTPKSASIQKRTDRVQSLGSKLTPCGRARALPAERSRRADPTGRCEAPSQSQKKEVAHVRLPVSPGTGTGSGASGG